MRVTLVMTMTAPCAPTGVVMCMRPGVGMIVDPRPVTMEVAREALVARRGHAMKVPSDVAQLASLAH
jgi:hypothetical protein